MAGVICAERHDPIQHFAEPLLPYGRKHFMAG
jgi:hypothetical protein